MGLHARASLPCCGYRSHKRLAIALNLERKSCDLNNQWTVGPGAMASRSSFSETLAASVDSCAEKKECPFSGVTIFVAEFGGRRRKAMLGVRLVPTPFGGLCRTSVDSCAEIKSSAPSGHAC